MFFYRFGWLNAQTLGQATPQHKTTPAVPSAPGENDFPEKIHLPIAWI
jgi:hypothetical protein